MFLPFYNFSAINNISVITSSILFNYFSSFDVSFLVVAIVCISFTRCSTLPFRSVFAATSCNGLLLLENLIEVSLRMVIFLRLFFLSIRHPFLHLWIIHSDMTLLFRWTQSFRIVLPLLICCMCKRENQFYLILVYTISSFVDYYVGARMDHTTYIPCTFLLFLLLRL